MTASITAAQMIGISNGVHDFVLNCFASVADAKTRIDAGTVTSLSAIDAAFS